MNDDISNALNVTPETHRATRKATPLSLRAVEMRSWGDFWAVMGVLGFALCLYAGVQAGRVPVDTSIYGFPRVRYETAITVGMLLYFWLGLSSVLGGFFWRSICISHSLLLDAAERHTP